MLCYCYLRSVCRDQCYRYYSLIDVLNLYRDMFVETIEKDVKSFERKLGYQRGNSIPSTTVGAIDLLISEINHQLLKAGREIGGKKERTATKKEVLKALKSYAMVQYKMTNEVPIVAEAELLMGERIGVHGPEFRGLLSSFICIYEDSGFSFSAVGRSSGSSGSSSSSSSSSSNDDKDLEDEKNSREEVEEEEVWDRWNDATTARMNDCTSNILNNDPFEQSINTSMYTSILGCIYT